MYLERDEESRQVFLKELDQIPKGKLVYLDESGIEESLHRKYGRSARGELVRENVTGKSKRRLSFIAAWNGQTMKAPLSFEGYTDTDVFNFWVKDRLVPELKPGQTVILDNASFHKSPITQTLIENAGCHLKYLPTYSPDMNPIENQWAILKARIRKHRQKNQSLQKVISDVFELYYLKVK